MQPRLHLVSIQEFEVGVKGIMIRPLVWVDPFSRRITWLRRHLCRKYNTGGSEAVSTYQEK